MTLGTKYAERRQLGAFSCLKIDVFPHILYPKSFKIHIIFNTNKLPEISASLFCFGGVIFVFLGEMHV